MQTIRVLLRQQISRFLLKVLNILLLDSLDELFEQILLEVLEVLLVRVCEGLAWLWEAADVAKLDFLAALFKSLLDVALHVVDLFLH